VPSASSTTRPSIASTACAVAFEIARLVVPSGRRTVPSPANAVYADASASGEIGRPSPAAIAAPANDRVSTCSIVATLKRRYASASRSPSGSAILAAHTFDDTASTPPTSSTPFGDASTMRWSPSYARVPCSQSTRVVASTTPASSAAAIVSAFNVEPEIRGARTSPSPRAASASGAPVVASMTMAIAPVAWVAAMTVSSSRSAAACSAASAPDGPAMDIGAEGPAAGAAGSEPALAGGADVDGVTHAATVAIAATAHATASVPRAPTVPRRRAPSSIAATRDSRPDSRR
jgi:hypothetical protein